MGNSSELLFSHFSSCFSKLQERRLRGQRSYMIVHSHSREGSKVMPSCTHSSESCFSVIILSESVVARGDHDSVTVGGCVGM